MTVQNPRPTRRNQGSAPEAPSQVKKGSARWVALALLPIACCGLPLLLAAGAAAGTGAVLGGVAGVVLLLVAVVLAAVPLRRRRRRHAACRTDLNSSARSGKGC